MQRLIPCQYGVANEHKTPGDFNGKKEYDDDDDEDGGSPGPEAHPSPNPQLMPPQFQNQPGFQHIRHHTPSASPPIGNGQFPHPHPHPQRQHTPQAQPLSRPTSRNAPRRPSSNLVQHHMPQMSQPPPPVNGYAYMPNPAIYNPQVASNMPHPQSMPPQAPSYQYPGPPPHHQMQHVYMEDQRRQSMPPAFPQQERPMQGPNSSPPQPQTQMPDTVKRNSVKARSIFTPIDEGRSILSQHWGPSTTATVEAPKPQNPSHMNSVAASRAQSVDVGSMARQNGNGPSPPRAQTHNKNRNISMSSMSEFAPPSRTGSAQMGAKRPRLKVQIPDEPSDGGSGTADSSPRDTTGSAGQASQRAGTEGSHSSGVVLPPPSPSTNILSAGATGPPNPFARPHPPNQVQNQNQNQTQNQMQMQSQNQNQGQSHVIDTPVSALPSRFMANEFLPSPSSLFSDWGGNTLPSPLNFQTPIVSSGPSFLRDEPGLGMNGKRKTPEGEMEENGEPKRIKHEM